MTINYTTLLGLAKPVTGTETGQWGDVVNDEITSLLEDAVANAATFSVTSGNVTLTTTNGSSNQARMSTLIITGSPGTTRNVIAPSQAKVYVVINQSDGAVVIKGAATTGVTVGAGQTAQIAWNGSDFVEVGNYVHGNFVVNGNLTVNGNSTLGDAGADTTTINGQFIAANSAISKATTLTTSVPALTWIKGQTYTDTGTAGGTTQAHAPFNLISAPTLSTSNIVTYTNASTLYVAGAPTAGGSATITNPYALYVAAGANYFGGASTFAVDATVYGITVGRGAGAVSTNTAVGASALAANTTGSLSSAFGYQAAYSITTNPALSAFGYQSGYYMTDANDAFGHQALYGASGASGYYNSAFGYKTLFSLTSGTANTAFGRQALYSNTTASNNTAVGYQAGYSNTGVDNTFVGYQSGLTNTTGTQNVYVGRSAGAIVSSSTGSNNSVLGFGALVNLTSGSNNIAIGTSTLQANTTASNNTAVGYQAGYSNTTGANNQVFGYQALYSNQTGNNNAAFGTGALSANTGSDNAAFGSGVTAVAGGALVSNTSGERNSAFGGGAASSNTTGSYNTAIGTLALKSNTTASNNTAVGYQAGYSNSTGTNGTYIGFQAGYQTTGSNNTAIGLSAGYNVTAGTWNTFLGVNAGPNSGTASTGSYNVAIGGSALQANTTASNNTAVGYQAGYSNTSGSDNTAIGYYAYRNGTASYNLAIGAYSMSTATVTGVQNSAIGRYALGALTSGSYNISLGDDSLRNNTTSSSNVAIGFQSLYGYDNPTGGNIAIGDGAMYSVNHTTGSNIAIGTGTLRGSSATGTGNVGIGQAVMYPLTSGGSNTIVGGYNGVDTPPGRYLTTGSYNSVLGTSAFANAIGANNTVAVGYQAAYNAVSVGSSVFVGYQAGYTGNGEYGYNTVVGYKAGYSLSNTSGAYGNTFVGCNSQTGTGAGYSVSTGTQNTILGGYSGNQGGLDIRTSSNFIVLSDGAGNPRIVNNGTVTATPTIALSASSNADTGSFSQIRAADGATGSTDARLLLGNSNGAYANMRIVSNSTSNLAVDAVAGNNTNSPLDLLLNVNGGKIGMGVGSINSSGGVLQLASGITFPATQSASSNANTLDDYEEGSWTPTLTGSSGSITVTSTSGQALYTKIGNLVMITCGVGWSSSTLSGTISIGGFPFATNNGSSAYRAAATFGYVSGITFSGQLVSDIPHNATSGTILYLQSGSAPANVSLASTGALQFTFVYQV